MIGPMAHVHRRARPDEFEAIGAVLGRAFASDPVWRWFVTDDDRIAQRNATILSRFAAEYARVGHIEVEQDLGGAAIWVEPKRWRLHPSRMLRHAPAMLAAVGPRRLHRIRHLALTEQHHPREPHWYLAVVGVEPDLAGRGIGSTLLRPQLRRCDAELMPAYLESSKFENLPLYERLGFEVTAELDLPDGGPRLWSMWRDPDPSRLDEDF